MEGLGAPVRSRCTIDDLLAVDIDHLLEGLEARAQSAGPQQQQAGSRQQQQQHPGSGQQHEGMKREERQSPGSQEEIAEEEQPNGHAIVLRHEHNVGAELESDKQAVEPEELDAGSDDTQSPTPLRKIAERKEMHTWQQQQQPNRAGEGWEGGEGENPAEEDEGLRATTGRREAEEEKEVVFATQGASATGSPARSPVSSPDITLEE